MFWERKREKEREERKRDGVERESFFLFSVGESVFQRHLCLASLGGSCVEERSELERLRKCLSLSAPPPPPLSTSIPPLRREQIAPCAAKGGGKCIGFRKGGTRGGALKLFLFPRERERREAWAKRARRKREREREMANGTFERKKINSPAAPSRSPRGPPPCTPWSRTGSSP